MRQSGPPGGFGKSPPVESQPPEVIAHRGGGGEAPENSWSSLAHVRALGIRVMETDVHMSADGVAVLIHDPVVDRVLDGCGSVRDLRWEELRGMRDAAGDPPVRLDEALTSYPEVIFNIDAKEDAAAGPLERMAQRWPGRIRLASFSDARLRYIRSVNPAVETSLGQVAVARLVAASTAPLPLASNLVRAGAARYAFAAQVPVRFGPITVVTRRFIRLCHRLDLAVHVWTIDEPAQMHQLAALGVDGLITDYPRLALETLGRTLS